MKSECKYTKILDVVEIRHNLSPRPTHDYMSSKGIPLVKSVNETADFSKYITRTNEHIISGCLSKSVVIESKIVIYISTKVVK